jgi:FMN phosphatase YigB (HAD superfamily)
MSGPIPPLDYSKFRAVLFDVDGTLYDQRRLRTAMALELALFCFTHPHRLREAKIVSKFRHLREEHFQREEPSLLEAQYRWTAEALNLPVAQIRPIIDDWILVRPLRHLPNCRPPGLLELFERLHRKNIKIGVFSDYPPNEKLAALSLRPDASACALDAPINRFKPHPAGLQHVCALLGVDPCETLHIGDRADRDEPAARSCGAESIVLPAHLASKIGRAQSYDLLFPE